MKTIEFTEFEQKVLDEILKTNGGNLATVWHKSNYRTGTSYYSLIIFIDNRIYDISCLMSKFGEYRLDKHNCVMIGGYGYDKSGSIVENTLIGMGVDYKTAEKISNNFTRI